MTDQESPLRLNFGQAKVATPPAPATQGVASTKETPALTFKPQLANTVEAPKAPVAKALTPSPKLAKPAVKAVPTVESDVVNPLLDEDDAQDEMFQDLLSEDEDDDYVAPRASERKPAGPRRALADRGEDRMREHMKNLSRRSRMRLSEADKAILAYLDRVRFARKEELWIVVRGTCPWTKPRNSTVKATAPTLRAVEERANRLYRYGFLERRAAYGQPNLYTLSRIGKSEVGGQNKVLEKHFALDQVPHTLAVNNLIARLLAGETTELAAIDIKGKMAAEAYVSEPDLFRFIGAELQRINRGSAGYTIIGAQKQQLLSSYAAGASTVMPEKSEEDWIFGIYPENDKTFHNPDLMIKQGRTKGSQSGQCVAVEVELHAKSVRRYEKILKDYKDEFSGRSVYCKVVWIVADNTIMRKIERVRDSIGLPEAQCVVVLQDSQGGESA